MTKMQGPGFELQKGKQNNVQPGDRQRLFEEHIRRWQDSGLTQTVYDERDLCTRTALFFCDVRR